MIILFLSDTLSAAALVANPARNECAPNSLTGQTFIAACEVRDRVRCHSASADSHGAFIAPNCGKIHRRTAEASEHDRAYSPPPAEERRLAIFNFQLCCHWANSGCEHRLGRSRNRGRRWLLGCCATCRRRRERG